MAPISAATMNRLGQPNKGFTLVEALVVATLMGILAAVAIPAYLGFVRAQQESSAKSLAQTAAVNANAILRRGVTPTAEMVRATLFLPDPGAYTIGIVVGPPDSVSVIDNYHSGVRASAAFQ